MTGTVKSAAAIGGGVIGGGWIARFLLNGYDVKVFDPHPQAERLVGEVLANAERAFRKLTLAPMAPKGKLSFVSSIEEAVCDADYVQESVPERLDLKRKVYAEIEKHAKESTLIGSSTSGFKPTELIEGFATPERLFVAHPFNPVYLLPVVEVVPGQTSPDNLERAKSFLTAIGMKPLVVRKEIDAHIADRLLEAVWREGLWLIHDGVATTEEIDDVIRFGFGLRWAQMGLFETYRIAGGEAGMRHFMSQFGPALKWPWTKLMDVPDLTDDLIDIIAAQSDAQSGKHSIRELERIRDDNLVAIMQALKGNDWGAGALLKEYESTLYANAHSHARPPTVDPEKPLALHADRVREDWVDYNGHMTESRYLQVFGDATDAFLHFIGMNKHYLASGRSLYTVETHIRHLREAKMGAPLRVETLLLGFDQKRVRIVHELYGGPQDELLATGEHMLLHVDTTKSAASPMDLSLSIKLGEVWKHHRHLEAPAYAGKPVREIMMESAAAS
ncbi:carnitine 3-dehydrogenase [Rhizobium grahamii]|uniref:L-carnitine dehydrogenase n=1 Tax=Rhizobium grahamii TaxID=1120045 RepID=A0A370KP29_9HYPH|nr:carnitine 3-dehydrogenase [Rhizobium grahamii]RDJ10663.1 carnitine 3-dehydrogenase [Rhizobium grahamii]